MAAGTLKLTNDMLDTGYAILGLFVAAGFLLASGPGIVLIQIVKFCIKALAYMAHSGIVAFFFGTERDVRRYRDPLMDMIADNPLNSMAFMRRVMHIATISSGGASVPCAIYLFKNWAACEPCDRPVRWWLLFTCLMAFLQVPLRIVFSLRLRYLSFQRIDVMTAGVNYLTSSRAWCLSKTLSLANYAWFVLGVFWTLTSNGCTEAPFLIYASLGVILSSLMRLLLTVASFYCYFPGPPTQAWRDTEPGGAFFNASLRPLPLDKSRIDSLPFARYAKKKKDTNSNNDSPVSNSPDICPICINEFETNDLIRRLPYCQHLFHVTCIDKWLSNCGACPLCQRPLNCPQ